MYPKICNTFYVKEYSMFSCRNLIVSSLTHRCLIHFELILYAVSGNVPRSCSCIIFLAPLFKRLYFLHLYFCLLCCRLVDHKCLGLFLSSIRLGLFLGSILFRPAEAYERSGGQPLGLLHWQHMGLCLWPYQTEPLTHAEHER